MKIMHIAGGGDRGGAKTHILALCSHLQKTNELKLVSLRHGEFAEDALKTGIDTVSIQSRLPLKDFRRLRALVKEFRPDIIHCHGAKANTAGVMLKLFCGCTVVTTVHSDYRLDYMHSFIRRHTFGRLNSLALRLMDYRITVSDTFKKMLIERGFQPNRLMTIYNGLDFSTSTPDFDKTEYLHSVGLKSYQPGDVVLGIAARLTPVKDIPTLLRAFAAAHASQPRLKLLIGGEGEDLQKLQALTRQLHIEESVCFCGWITQIGKFFKACDIDVLSSISESFPYSILEGIKEHCAIITSDVGGMNKLIDHGENGFIYQPGDDKTFASYLVRLASDEPLRRSFAEKLYQKASVIYSLEGMAARQNEIYSRIMALKQRGKRNGIVICGAYGRGNSGDEAILDAILQTMQRIDPLSPITVMTRKPRETRLLHEVNTVYTFHLPKFHRAMRRARLFINGGGSLIQDVTSSRSLYFYLYTIAAAKHRGCKVLMYGCGVGRVRRRFNRRLAADTLNRNVDIITLRDTVSQQELAEMGVTKPSIRMAADPATILCPAPPEKAEAFLAEQGVPADGRYLCFALRPWGGFHHYALFARAAEYAYEKYGLTAVFLPIEVPRDLSACTQAASTMRTPHYVVASAPSDVTLTMAVLRQMKLVCGMRLHSIVFSAVAQVPFFAVSYDIKVDGFMKYIGKNQCCPLAEVQQEWLCAQIDALMQQPDSEESAAIAHRLSRLEEENSRAAQELLGLPVSES
ncbi:polysaccharide pyruvyl transferase CsaB [Acidaminobacterium chupaoyuni]